ncbi:zinc-ribbon domain-containing protein, partial [Anaerosporobacter sp.]
FTCPTGVHESEQKNIFNVVNNGEHLICCACNSFAQWGINEIGEDFLIKYWDYKKNNIDPWIISTGSKKKIWIKCQKKDYHGSYETSCFNFTNGRRCSYCHTFKLHKHDSLGYLYPEVFNIWSELNTKTPYEYSPNSNQKVWWRCVDNKHEDFKREIAYSTKHEFSCRYCIKESNESKLQKKVRLYLSDKLKYELNHELNCTILPVNPKTKCPLPFDNEVIKLKLIIEVHGIQHYEACGLHNFNVNRYNITPEQSLCQRRLYDRYKKFIAEHNGYSYLEIPYWTENDKSYMRLIDDKIDEILTT